MLYCLRLGVSFLAKNLKLVAERKIRWKQKSGNSRQREREIVRGRR
jgi:hypothetical protein